ncbi:MAG: glycosyltransferase [Planctomycetaceae bacterium]
MPASEQHRPAVNVESSQRSRVTFCITELDPGGAERALVKIAVGLRGLGWQVNVVSLRNAGYLAGQLRDAHIPVAALECGGFLDVRAVFRLVRVLKEQQPQLLVCFLHHANIAGRIAGRLAGVPVMVSGIRVADRRKSVIWTDRLTRGLTRKYVAVSRHVADLHADRCGIAAQDMAVIYNGVDVKEPPSLAGDRQDSQFRILFVGRLTPQKQPQNLVSAVAAFPDELKNRTVVNILGNGSLRDELEHQISSAALEKRIRLHGYQSNVTDWMAHADVLALPSAWEGLPNVVLEAMANGLPVVATAVDGVSELIESGVTGWLIPPNDIAALADALMTVAADAELRRRVANRAFEAVQQRFRWDITINAFDELLLDLLDSEADEQKDC